MTSVDIEYKRFGFRRRISVTMPARWEELSAEQLAVVARSFHDWVSEAEMIAVMCGIPEKLVKRFDEYQQYVLGKELDFMGEFKPAYAFVLKRVKKLTAPLPRMEGVSFAQFMYADTYYEKYVDMEDEKALDKFIACLYLPNKKEFSEKLIEERAEYVAQHLAVIEKTAISLNYRLVKEWITERYPFVFQKPAGDGEKKKVKPKSGSWVQILEGIVGDDIINQDKYARLPMHTVLRFLTQKIKEYARK